VRDLEEDAGLGQRVRAVQQTLAQNADTPSEEAVKAPDGVDPRLHIVSKMLFSHAPPPFMFVIVHYLFALVNYLG
jgi:hypothetical protein